MTRGGKVTVAVAATIAVVSIASAGYLYIERGNTVAQMTMLMAQVEQLNETVEQQSAEIAQQGETIKTFESASVAGIPPPVNVEDFDANDRELYDALKGLGLSEEEILEAMAGDGLGGVEGMGGAGSGGSGSFDTPSSNIDEPVAPPVVTPPSSQATTPKSPSGLTREQMEQMEKKIAEGEGGHVGGGTEVPGGDGKAQDTGSLLH